jgi:glycosyltransferase involved in cell wall biosynthesis
MNKPFLSIIIPAYNEETRLPGSLEKLAAFTAAKRDYLRL